MSTTRARPWRRFRRAAPRTPELRLAQLSRRHQRAGRHAGAQADDRHLASNAKVGRSPRGAAYRLWSRGRERCLEKRHGRAHVGVVIAGNEADVGRVAERPHPQRRAAELGRHADIDEIAGDGDMIGALRAQIRDEPGQQGHVVEPLRPRFQLMNPMTRFSRKSAKPGIGAGLRCGSVMCAIVKLILERPVRQAAAIDRAAIRLLEGRQPRACGPGPEPVPHGRADLRPADVASRALWLSLSPGR